MSLFDPVILFFVLGAFAGLVKSDLRVPEQFYHTLSIYLLLSIGIKGGIELHEEEIGAVLLPLLGTLLLGLAITLTAFVILRRLLQANIDNASAIAMHYGSVSAVTFAVVTSFLNSVGEVYEDYMTVILVMLELPAIALGLFIHSYYTRNEGTDRKKILHEILFGKSMLLMGGGLIIGLFIAETGNKQLNFFFLDLFKGFLAIFMLEMGLITAERFGDLRSAGAKLVGFGLVMPLINAVLGILVAKAVGMSLGGATVMATMAASASYIAAPAAARMAIPKANPTYYLTASLGVTFPFNIAVGITFYYAMAKWIYHFWG